MITNTTACIYIYIMFMYIVFRRWIYILFQTAAMINKILDVFKHRVTYHDWIDNKTTKGILDKVW